MKRCQLLFNSKKLYFSLIIVFIFLAKDNFGQEKRIPGFPTFAIYVNKIPVYATLSGSFSFYPEKEVSKTESYLKALKQINTKITGSSFLSVKYENKVYKFYELENIESEWNLEEGSIHIVGKIPNTQVEIFTVLKNQKERENAFIFSYGAINHSNRIVDIGFRSLLDVCIECNEGIPLKINTENFSEKEIYSHEFKFTPYKSNYWETYESDEVARLGIRNHLTGKENSPPDQIAFANWDKAFGTDWQYFTNKNIRTSPNTAVITWWNPRPVKAGESFELFTEYEIKKKEESVSFYFIDTDTGSGRLHIKAENKTDYRKKIQYILDVGKNAILTLNNNNPLEFILNGKSILDKIIPITIHGKGKINFSIKEKFNSIEKNYELPLFLNKTNQDQSPKFWKSSKYPIIYNADKDGLKLKGIVRAKDSGKKLGETDLISVKSIEDNYVYLGEVDLNEYYGEVFVEIFKQ